jgi:hypothetical protein
LPPLEWERKTPKLREPKAAQEMKLAEPALPLRWLALPDWLCRSLPPPLPAHSPKHSLKRPPGKSPLPKELGQRPR